MLEAQVPLLRVRVLKVVIAEVKLVDRQELVKIIALARKDRNVARGQYGPSREVDRREGCGKSQLSGNSRIGKGALRTTECSTGIQIGPLLRIVDAVTGTNNRVAVGQLPCQPDAW